MNAAFDALPDSADCWVYASDRPLDTEEVRLLEGLFQSFEREWSSHGRKVVGACQVVDARVVVVAASVQQGDISGCGIDKSLHLLQDVAASRGFSWVSALQIVYRDSSGQLQVSSRKAFREEAAAGRVNEDTWIFRFVISVHCAWMAWSEGWPIRGTPR